MQIAFELLNSIVNLQLGKTNMEEWLGDLARITKCSGAAAISWTPGQPESANIDRSSPALDFDPVWVTHADRILQDTDPQIPELLSTLAKQTDISIDSATKNPLTDPNYMIASLDSNPASTLLVLHCTDKPDGWSKQDREHFRVFLPAFLNAHKLHKKIVNLQNNLDIANRVLNGTPRGIICIDPNGEIINVNNMGQDILDRQDSFSAKDNKLTILNPKVDKQLHEQLHHLVQLPTEQLPANIWNRSFPNLTGAATYQISLRMYERDHWRVEANAHKRFAVLIVYSSTGSTQPTIKQLREFYDLTEAQARLVGELLAGHSASEAADNLHISINTVRSHLRSIYTNLAVDNQTDLMRMLSSTLVSYTKKGPD